jgi:hypothetical protein
MLAFALPVFTALGPDYAAFYEKAASKTLPLDMPAVKTVCG